MQFTINEETVDFPVISVPLAGDASILCALVDRFNMEEAEYAVLVEVTPEEELSDNMFFFLVDRHEDGGVDLNIIQDEIKIGEIRTAYVKLLGL